MTKLIVEMEMPKSCPCELATEVEGNFYPCFAYYGVVSRSKEFDYCVANATRSDWCPIKGVLPEEHGDLVDLDEVKQLIRRYRVISIDNDYQTVERLFDEKLHTVIAAERKDDEQI